MSFRPVSTLSRLYTTTTAPSAVGICRIAPGSFPISSSDIGASVAPKSTVPAVICLIPPPEPIDW